MRSIGSAEGGAEATCGAGVATGVLAGGGFGCDGALSPSNLVPSKPQKLSVSAKVLVHVGQYFITFSILR